MLQPQVLDRNQALVVVHRDHDIELARAGAHEDGIGRMRSTDIEPFGPRLLHRRCDLLDFLAAEQAALARMRIDAGDRDARRASELARQMRGRDAQGLQHIGRRHRFERIAQRDMDADQHGAQLVVRQHHAHWQLGDRTAQVRGRQRLQEFGMAGMFDPGRGQRLLVDRRGDDGADLAAQRSLRGPGDAVGRGTTGARVDPTPFG